MPFLKNNPRESEARPSDQPEEKKVPATMTARQREIENLRQSLLAPQPKPGVQKPQEESQPEESKYQRAMDWGTPRLVTKNRQIVMDQNQLKSRAFLQNMAAERKGQATLPVPEKKQEFAPVSVSNFRQKMLEEEKLNMQQESNTSEIMQQSSFDTLQKSGPQIAGQGFFNKLRHANEEEIKSKLK